MAQMKKPVAGMVAYPPTKKTPKPKSTGPSVISKIKGAFKDKPKYTSEQIVAEKKMQAEIDAAKKNKSKTTTKPKTTTKAPAKKVSNGSDTKPYNVRPIKPAEIIKDKPKPKTTPKAPAKAPAKAKMTPQDAAMKKLLEKKYGKIYG